MHSEEAILVRGYHELVARHRAKEEFASGRSMRHAAEVAALRKRLEAGEITQDEFQRAIAELDEAA